MIVRWKPGVIPEPGRFVVSWCFDGDTVRGSGNPGAEIVRVWGIDAPERGQRFYRQSGAALWAMVGRRAARLEPVCRDKYGRLVGRLIVPEFGDVGLEMVRNGWAWWYRQYAVGAVRYREAEREARYSKRGLWGGGPHRWAPWAWRRKYARHGAPAR